MKKRTKSAIGKQNRKRGQDFERLVAKELAKVWPEARRNLSQTRTAKKEGGDILGVPFHAECKSGKRVDLRTAWAQAVVDSGDSMRAVVLYKEGRQLMAMCMMPVSSLLSVFPRMPLHDYIAYRSFLERSEANAR